MTDKEISEIASSIMKSIVDKSSLIWTVSNYEDSAKAIAEIYKVVYQAVKSPNI